MVIPTPTAEPLMAAMVGFEQLCIASETLPPLGSTFSQQAFSFVRWEIFDYYLPISMLSFPRRFFL